MDQTPLAEALAGWNTQPHTAAPTAPGTPGPQPQQPVFPPISPEVAALVNAIGQLGTQQAQMLQHLAGQGQPNVQVAVPNHDLWPKPNKFKGDRGLAASNFLMEISGYIQRRIHDYPTINDQVYLALSYMEDKANDWKHRYLARIGQGQTPFQTWGEFEQEFRLSFERIQDAAEAMAELKRYKQGSLSVAEYHAHFDTLAGRTNLSEFDKKERFYDGLADRIKDALTTTSKPIGTYIQLVRVSIELDNRATQRQWERQQDRGAHRPNPWPRVQIPRPAPAQPAQTVAPPRDPNAMDVDASRVCYNCGQKGHIRRFCRNPPKLAQGRQIKATGQEPVDLTATIAALTSSINSLKEKVERMEASTTEGVGEGKDF